MSEGTLFELPACEERPTPAPTGREDARVLRPMRQQLQWAPVDLESLVPQDHPARAIWGFLEKLDLSAFYEPIKAVVDRPGRPTTDPQVLLALWLLATVEGDRERPTAGAIVRRARCLPLGAWPRAHQLPHAVGLSSSAPRGLGRPADPDHRFVDGRRGGQFGASGSRRDAGASERRGGILSWQGWVGGVPADGADTGRSAGARARAS